MRLRALSISTTSTVTVSPRLTTSSTFFTRSPLGARREMWSRPSVPFLSSTKAPKSVVLTHASGEHVADLDLLGHRLDAVLDAFRSLLVGGADEDRAVVLDVDVGAELLGHAADGLAALADDEPDLVGVDLDREDARRPLAELAARLGDGLGHLAEDEQAGLARLLERLGEDLEGHAGDLDVHLQGGDALGGAGDLEVHVAEVVFHAGDVGEHDVVVALLDETHRGAGHRGVICTPASMSDERRAADAGHGGRAVALEDLGHDADRVGERRPRREGPAAGRARRGRRGRCRGAWGRA